MSEALEAWPGARRYESAGGVVIDGDRVLLLDRPVRGEVRLPKGHIEPGEAPDEAALRETAEETGYADLEIEADLGAQDVAYETGGGPVVRREHYFLMRLASHAQLPRSASDAAQFHPLWTPIGDAADLLTYEAERDALRRAVTAMQAAEDRGDVD